MQKDEVVGLILLRKVCYTYYSYHGQIELGNY